MIVLDTNVVSELMRPGPAPAVLTWLDEQNLSELVVTAVTVFEVEFGLMRMPAGQRRTDMEESWNRMVTTLHPVGVLKLDYEAAVIAAELDAARQGRGITLDFRDAFIAGIVLANDARIATRNVRHFADLGNRVIDPWFGPLGSTDASA